MLNNEESEVHISALIGFIPKVIIGNKSRWDLVIYYIIEIVKTRNVTHFDWCSLSDDFFIEKILCFLLYKLHFPDKIIYLFKDSPHPYCGLLALSNTA